MEIGAQKDMRLRSTPMPLAGSARAFPAVPGRGGYRKGCAVFDGAALSYPGGTQSPLDYMHIPPSIRMISPVM